MLAMTHGATDDDFFGHFQAPDENDVVIVPVPCFANEDGFGGSRTESSFTAEYYYEMVYRSGGDSAEEVIASFEKDSTNFILQSDLFSSPCSEVEQRQANSAQGISARPDDQALQGISCSSISGDAAAGTDCLVISGAFEVFYDDNGSGSDALKQQFEEAIKNGINNGGVTISHPDIVEVEAVPDPTGNVRDKDDAVGPSNISAGPGDDGNNTPLIVGATVGAVLIIGAAALYRSRQAGASASSAAAPASGADTPGADV